MIDTKIFSHGAVSILIEVASWKGDKVTPKTYKCTVTAESHSPSAVVAVRDTAIAAERECVEKFLELFSKKERRVHPATKDKRVSDEKPVVVPQVKEAPLPAPKKPAKPIADDFEY